MAFFKFRLPGQASTTAGRREPAAGAAQAESVDAIRRRARHRLIGASVLVLIAVIGFPLLFDTQPRPVAVDIPIRIPDRNQARPLTIPAAPPVLVTRPAEATPGRTDAPAVPGAGAASAPAAKPVLPRVSETAPREAPAANRAASVRPPAAAEVPARPVAPAKPAVRPDDGSRARALLDGKPVAPQAADDRLVLQVGAYADAAKAREVRQKLERAGLKTYTQVVDGREGRRIRVRVGPFATKGEADKAANRIRKLDLPVALLSL